MAYIPQPKDVTNFLGSTLTPQTYSPESQYAAPASPSPTPAAGATPSFASPPMTAAPTPDASNMAAGAATPPMPQTQPQVNPSPWQSAGGMMGGGGIDLKGILSVLGGNFGKGDTLFGMDPSATGGGTPPAPAGMFTGGAQSPQMQKLQSMWGGNGQNMLRGLFGG